jgi:hypothetical protein
MWISAIRSTQGSTIQWNFYLNHLFLQEIWSLISIPPMPASFNRRSSLPIHPAPLITIPPPTQWAVDRSWVFKSEYSLLLIRCWRWQQSLNGIRLLIWSLYKKNSSFQNVLFNAGSGAQTTRNAQSTQGFIFSCAPVCQVFQINLKITLVPWIITKMRRVYGNVPKWLHNNSVSIVFCGEPSRFAKYIRRRTNSGVIVQLSAPS